MYWKRDSDDTAAAVANSYNNSQTASENVQIASAVDVGSRTVAKMEASPTACSNMPIDDACYFDFLSLIQSLSQDAANTIVIKRALSNLSAIFARVVETRTDVLQLAIPALSQLLTHPDVQVRMQCCVSFELISSVFDVNLASKIATSENLRKFLDFLNTLECDLVACSLRILCNLARLAEDEITRQLVISQSICRLTGLLKMHKLAAPSSAHNLSFATSTTSLNTSSLMHSSGVFLSDAECTPIGEPVGSSMLNGAVPRQRSNAMIVLEILFIIMEWCSKKGGDGDARMAIMQLNEAEGFEVVMDYLPSNQVFQSQSNWVFTSHNLNLNSDGISGRSEMDLVYLFASELTSNHIVPFLIFEVLSGKFSNFAIICHHLSMQKQFVIHAYVHVLMHHISDASYDVHFFGPFLNILKSSCDGSLIVGVLQLLQGIVIAGQQACGGQTENPCFAQLERHGFSETIVRLQTHEDGDVSQLANDCVKKCGILRLVCANLGVDSGAAAAAACGQLKKMLMVFMDDEIFSTVLNCDVLSHLIHQLKSANPGASEDCAVILNLIVEWARIFHKEDSVAYRKVHELIIQNVIVALTSDSNCDVQSLSTLLKHGFVTSIKQLHTILQRPATNHRINFEFIQIYAGMNNPESSTQAVAANRLRMLLQTSMSDEVNAAVLNAGIISVLVRLLVSAVPNICNDCAACLGYLAAFACKCRDASSGDAALEVMIRLLHEVMYVPHTEIQAVVVPFLNILKSSCDGSLIVGVLQLLQGIVIAGQQACGGQTENPCFAQLERHGFSETVVRLQTHEDGDVSQLANDCVIKCDILQFLIAEIHVDDCLIVASAAGRLKQSLQACTSDGFIAAVLVASSRSSPISALVRHLSSSNMRIGDDCAACLGYLAACVCKGADASSHEIVLASIMKEIEDAITCDSQGLFLFFRPLVSALGCEAGFIRLGLSKILYRLLSTVRSNTVVQHLVVSNNIMSIILQCLESADDVGCFSDLLSIIVKTIDVFAQGASNCKTIPVAALIELNALKVLNLPHLIRSDELKDWIYRIIRPLFGFVVTKLQSEAITAAENTTSFLDSLAEYLEVVAAGHMHPAKPCLRSRPDDVVCSCMRGDAYAFLHSPWLEQFNKQRTLRVFLSSTFTDTVHERAVLLRCVLPVVQDYARKINFEVVFSEMRFGIRKTLSDDNKTSEICMMELERCSNESASMSYFLFVRNKYGFRPPPRKVPQCDMEAMLALMPAADKDLVNEFYILDENELVTPQECYRISVNMHAAANVAAPAYVLKNSSLISNYWTRFAELQIVLRNAATLYWPSGLNELDDYRSQHPIRFFFFSVTEEEICRGLFWKDMNDIQHSAHVFLRPINACGGCELSSLSPSTKELSKFVDVADNVLDASARDRLATLKIMIDKATAHVSSVVSKSCNVVEWLDGVGFHPKHAPHAIDLQEFACSATLCLLQSLDSGNERLAVQPHPDMDEIIHHMKFAHERHLQFMYSSETQQVISKLRNYLGAEIGPGHAFVVYGASGSGKTCIMAEAADECARLRRSRYASVAATVFHQGIASDIMSPNGAAVIVRFIGTSPASSNLASLLGSICKQLESIQKSHSDFCHDYPSNGDIHKLIEYFQDALKTWCYDRLIVFLDSLDQLDDSFGGRKLQWLPTHGLSPNVRLVVSTLPDETAPADGKPFGCLSVLQKRYSGSSCDSAMAEVQPVEDVRSLLLHLLKLRQRKLTDAQFCVLEAAIKLSPRTQTPLAVSILAVRFSEWPSHCALPQDNKNPDGSLFVDTSSVRALIVQEFKALEAKHGRELVHAALSFITLTKDGVSETELSEILSLDDDVLASVYEWWVPPVRTLPTNPLTMLLSDLKPYLTKCGTTVGSGGLMMRWYHRQFWEAANEYFLHDDKERRFRHAQLGEYFSGVWAGCRKPYNHKLKAAVQKKIHGEVCGDRQVRSQTLCMRQGKNVFSTKDDSTAVNERRCREAVHHMLEAGKLRDAIHELCDFEGICARARCGEGFTLLKQLIQLGQFIRDRLKLRDVEAARVVHQLRRVEDYTRWLKRNMSAIAVNPVSEISSTCSCLSKASLARQDFETFYQRSSDGIKFDGRASFRSFALQHVNHNSDACLYVLKQKGMAKCVAYNFDSSRLASISLGENVLYVWETKSGMAEFVLKSPLNDITSLAWSCDGKGLAAGEILCGDSMIKESFCC